MKRTLRNIIRDCKAELHDIEAIVSSSPLDNRVSYITMYSLIKCCGTIEYVFKSIVADFFDKSSIPQIHHYVDNTFREKAANPSYDNICNALKKFDDQWYTNFKTSVRNHPDSARIQSSINSLVNNRNQFAHGNNPTVGFAQIKDYFEDSIEVIALLDQSVN